MNTKPLRILALAAVVAWQGADGTRAQQLPQPTANGQSALGLEHFRAGPQPQAIPAAYRQPVVEGPSTGELPPSHVPASPAPPQIPGYAPGQYAPAPYAPGPYVPGQYAPGPYAPQYEGAVYGGHEYQGQAEPTGYFQPGNEPYFDPYSSGEPGVTPCHGACGEYGLDAIYPPGQCYGYTRAEVFVLSRDIKGDQDFTSRGPQGPIVLRASDLDLEYEAGIRGVAGVPIGPCLMLEASYFGMQEWSSSAAATDPTDFLFSVYSGFGTSGGFIVGNRNVLDFIDGSRRQSIDFHSELHNAELNLMYRVPVRSCKQEAWLIAGARYVKVDENLQYRTESGPNDPVLLIRTSFTDVQTENDLVGGQLGGILHHHITKKLRVSLDAKAAMMINFSEQQSFVTTNLFPLGGERMTDDSLALVTDAGASLAFDVTCWCSVTGGYRMMYVDGLALGVENFNPVLPGSGLRQPFLNDNGSILYHGAHLGAEIRW